MFSIFQPPFGSIDWIQLFPGSECGAHISAQAWNPASRLTRRWPVCSTWRPSAADFFSVPTPGETFPPGWVQVTIAILLHPSSLPVWRYHYDGFRHPWSVMATSFLLAWGHATCRHQSSSFCQPNFQLTCASGTGGTLGTSNPSEPQSCLHQVLPQGMVSSQYIRFSWSNLGIVARHFWSLRIWVLLNFENSNQKVRSVVILLRFFPALPGGTSTSKLMSEHKICIRQLW